MVIAQKAVARPVPRVVDATADIAATAAMVTVPGRRTRPRLTFRRGVAAAGPAAEQGRDGRDLVRPCCTRPQK